MLRVPTASITKKRQLLLARVVVSLCVLWVITLMPRLAWASLTVPMCSPFGECTVAPPPEAPPTGGEVRGIRTQDPRAPSLDAAPTREPAPPPWQVPAPDPAALFHVLLGPIACRAREGQPNFSYLVRDANGASLEVFRPPRSDASAHTRHR
ncbi:MAG: hypothetical protein QM784_26920 [Polyangiaceae bacterium]